MRKFPAILLALMVCATALVSSVQAQFEPYYIIKSLSRVMGTSIEGKVVYNADGTVSATNGIYVQYNGANGSAVLMADNASLNQESGEVKADGNVHIESDNMVWAGDHVDYNFKTHQLKTEQFRTGRAPVFAGGERITGFVSKDRSSTNSVSGTNNVNGRGYLLAQHAFVTTDDYSEPFYEVRASTIKIIPGKKVQMWNAVAYLDGVPVFYFPYYERNIGHRVNNFTTTPGYRSVYGPYLLNTYNWYFGNVADGRIHADYRERRGPGVGPDLKLHLGRWGEADLQYYYQHDSRANISTNTFPWFGNIPENRQRFLMDWQATLATNLNLKAQVNYQSDPLYLHDFFPGYYTQNPQPNTFVEANKYWSNWSLDALTTPRINSFFSQVEREPDVKLTGFRQQIFNTPVYYDSESSIGWYRAWDANETNGLYPGTNGLYVDSAMRADTYHQLTMPYTFFNWLNVTPRVGGRATYYSSQNFTNGQPNSSTTRGVFNTGVEVSFKASQLWPDVTNSLLQIDGLRHIIEPSANYVYVPDPSVPPAQLPPFDSEAPSLMLLPVTFPDYNSIDSIDTMNVVRFGLRNILQTKRDGQLDDVLNWNLMMDWRLDPKSTQTTLNDLYSALAFRPRTWVTLESQLRYNTDEGRLNLAFHEITFQPNDRWSWGLSHWYLHSGFVSPDENNFISSTFFFRLDDNWGLRAVHTFNASDGRLQQQEYTVMRDLRSWTAALSFRVENNLGSSADFTVAFQFSLKAAPSTHLGEDALTDYHLVGE